MLSKIWVSYMHWYIQYSQFSELEEKEGLPYYRDKLFISIMLLTLVFSVISYVPSSYLAYTKKENSIFVIYTIIIAINIMIIINKSVSLNTKKKIFLTTFF